jgi:hypothetical protein
MTPNYEASVYDRTDLLYRYARPEDYDAKPEGNGEGAEDEKEAVEAS